MNRHQHETIAQPGPQDDTWETELEAEFFDDPLDVPAEPVVRAEPVVPADLEIPEDVDDPDTLERHTLPVFPADDVVIQVVPRWVWPTLGLLGSLAIGGTAFGLGALWAVQAQPVIATPVAPPVTTVEAAIAPEVPAAPRTAPEPPPIPPPAAKASPPKKAAKPAAAPRKRRPPTPPVAAPAPGPVPSPPPAVPATSVADLPTAVSVGALQPGAAL